MRRESSISPARSGSIKIALLLGTLSFAACSADSLAGPVATDTPTATGGSLGGNGATAGQPARPCFLIHSTACAR
jgi:hypothetical protein